MKNQIKKAVACSSACAVNAFSVAATYAAFGTEKAEKINDTAKGSLEDSATSLINYFLGFLGLIAVGFIIYAGILMVTAAGDDDAIGKGKKIITFAAVGIIIIMLAYGIVSWVANSLATTG